MEVNVKIDKVKLPDFLIVGAAKSGTSSLHQYLQEHPEVYMPWCKETCFFQLVNNPNKAILNKFNYLPTNFLSYTGLFEKASKNQICGEATPSYLYYYDLTIENIKKYHSNWQDLKIIIILREPINKVVSHYKFVHTQKLDPENLNLKEALNKESERIQENKLLLDLFYVDNTLYYNQVKAFLDTFSNVKIYLFEELKEDPNKLLKDLYTYVNVDPNFSPKSIKKVFNKSEKKIEPKNKFVNFLKKNSEGLRKLVPNSIKTRLVKILYKEEAIDEETLTFLKNAFREDVTKLQSLIKKDLSHWLRKYD